MDINLQGCKTPAQAVTKICYNESTRNLKYKIKVESLEDLKACVKIIKEYNNFDWKKINEALDEYCAFKRFFYGRISHKNRRDLLEFEIGRESSPVIYIHLREYGELKNKYKKDGKVEELKRGEFMLNVERFGKKTLADECDVWKEEPFGVSYRLWWD